MKAFVAGATGETGRRIVQELVTHNIPVRALVRNIEKAKEILPAEAQLVVGDVLNRASLDAAIGDSTVLLCASGASPSFDPTVFYKVDYQGTKHLVDAAKTKEIEHFVLVSSMGVSLLFHYLNLFGLVLVWKKQAENYLQNSGLTYTIVRPAYLKNEDNPDPIVMSSADTLFGGYISCTKVAQVCVEALTYPEARNKIVEVVAKPEATDQSWNQLFSGVL